MFHGKRILFMKKRFARWGNNLLLLGCAAVCLWCVGTKFQA